MKGEPLRFIRGHVGILKRRERLEPDLWREVDTGYATACWLCVLAPQHKRGYVKVWLRGEPVSAHRAMYEQEIGPIPAGLTIDHLCRQPSCMNPSHMEAVTIAENLRRGGRVRLSPELAQEIRASNDSNRVLAAKMGVSPSTVSQVRTGRIWRE